MEEMLIQIWLKFIKLLDKQVNIQTENLKKYFRGSRELLQAHEKVCNENETRKKRWAPKIFLLGGRSLLRAESSCNGYQMTSGQRLLIH